MSSCKLQIQSDTFKTFLYSGYSHPFRHLSVYCFSQLVIHIPQPYEEHLEHPNTGSLNNPLHTGQIIKDINSFAEYIMCYSSI